MLQGTRLDGIALIVGGASGIGKEAAFSMAEAGAKVIVIADIDEANAHVAAEQCKEHATNKGFSTAVVKVDVTEADQVQAMVDFVTTKFGRVDYAVNSAGIDNGVHKPLADTDIDRFDRVINVNTRGMLLCLRAETAAMRKQEPRFYQGRSGKRDIGRGAIVNIASANSFVGLPGKMSYTVSKHADIGLTKMAGIDHAAEGIRCNTVCPTWVRTPLLEDELRKNPQVEAMMQAIVPIKRIAEGDEVSDTIAYLCSPAASYVNGASLMIDAAVTTTTRLH